MHTFSDIIWTPLWRKCARAAAILSNISAQWHVTKRYKYTQIFQWHKWNFNSVELIISLDRKIINFCLLHWRTLLSFRRSVYTAYFYKQLHRGNIKYSWHNKVQYGRHVNMTSTMASLKWNPIFLLSGKGWKSLRTKAHFFQISSHHSGLWSHETTW